VAPWGEPTRPKDWYATLESHKLIFVAAQDSGNDKKVLERRIPLAILAYENVRARFPLNSQRVFIAGFSGGSRVAGMVALAYPDVFRGVIMNAGSDTIDGSAQGEGNFKPPAELFRVFQRSRLVYVTGDEDLDHVQQDKASRESMRDNCVQDIRDVVEPHVGHRAVEGTVLDRALDALDAPAAIDADELAHCNERLESKITAALGKVSAAIAHGDREEARTQLMALDARYGGLAAPRSLELHAKLGAKK
jgi:pimeloyl-ACP methyl ester carboxylesterase